MLHEGGGDEISDVLIKRLVASHGSIKIYAERDISLQISWMRNGTMTHLKLYIAL